LIDPIEIENPPQVLTKADDWIMKSQLKRPRNRKNGKDPVTEIPRTPNVSMSFDLSRSALGLRLSDMLYDNPFPLPQTVLGNGLSTCPCSFRHKTTRRASEH
jgi:hypothetical protein